MDKPVNQPITRQTGDKTVDLKAIREARQESQAAFAKHFGVNQSTLHRWETEGIPKRGSARKVIDQFLQRLGTVATARSNDGAAA